MTIKSLEAYLREVRSFVLPSHIAMYRRIIAERRWHNDSVAAGQQLAVLDLSSLKSDADAGRFVYLTWRRLHAAGYAVVFTRRFRTLANFQARRYKRLLIERDRPFLVAHSSRELDERGGLWISDSPESAPPRGDWLRVDIDYTHRLPRGAGEIAHTFTMHPDVYEFSQLIPHNIATSGDQRWCRIFFAGNTSPRAYARNRMGAGHPVMTRVESIAIARDAAAQRLTMLPARECETRSAAQAGEKSGFVMIDTGAASINANNWLSVMSKADFFFAAPGASFPLSHNAVEAMHAGTVPIIQYPQYFDPPLTHGVNCTTFRDAGELRQRIAEVLDMSEEKVAELRRGARDYYDRYLTLEPLVHRLREAAQQHGRARWMYFSFVAPVIE